MKYNHRLLKQAAALAIVTGTSAISPAITKAAMPVIEWDEGAYVRIVGEPADGTIKFQYGWASSTAASEAAGYWVGVYDVTNSEYLWAADTNEMELPDRLLRNAHPTTELPNGEYKVVFFVRESYEGPVTNIAEIELPFTVDNSMM